MMASTFLSTIYFFSSDKKEDIIPGIFSSAIFLSIKTLSLIFFILSLPFLFFKKEGRLNRKLLIFSVFFFIFSGLFSYIRNFILTGNPFFPAEVSFGNFILFKGIYTYSKTPFFEKLRNFIYLIKNPASQVDIPFKNFLIFIFFYMLSLFLSFKEKKIFYFLLIIPFSILLYLFLIPSCYHQTRHLLPIWGIFSISTVYPFRRVKHFLFFPLFLLYLALSQLKLSVFFPFFITLTFLSLFFPLYIMKKEKLLFIPLFLIFFYMAFWVSVFLPIYQNSKFKIWEKIYGERGKLWEFIQKEGRKNIAYIGEFLTFPFFGKDYKNEVFYQSVNSIKTFPPHLYKGKVLFPEENPERIYRKKPSFKKWFSGLKKKKVDWIIIRKEGDFIERKWIGENKKIFTKIFENKFAEIYQIRQTRFVPNQPL